MVCVFCRVPEDWGEPGPLPPGVTVLRDTGDLPPLSPGDRLVFGLNGMAASPGWMVVSDHLCVFGANPLVERNLFLGRVTFPNLRGMYLSPAGPWRTGTVLGVPSLVFATGAELRAFRADALVELTEYGPVLSAGASGVRVCVLVRCRGVSGEGVSTEPPLAGLVSSIAEGGEEQ